ncbi:MAG: nuclear transport factor 2 family protein [Gammaproteobacteria bacterium]
MSDTSTRTRAVVTAFLDALERGDGAALRATLSRGPFSFEGPVDRFDDAAAFAEDIERYALIITAIERRRLFVDGHEACVVLTFVTSLDNIPRTRAAVWVETDDEGLIRRVESFLDARAWTRMFGGGAPRALD